MKRLLVLALFSLLLTAVPFSSPPTVHAGFWTDDLGNCSSAYVSTSNQWKDYLDHNEISQAQYNADMETLQGLYTGCLEPIDVPAQDPDFCSQAYLANQDCIFQAQNLIEPDLGFAMQCRAKTGIDQCQ